RAKALAVGDALTIDADKLINLIHVEDGARTVVSAVACGTPGRTYNVCDDRPVLRREFYTRLAERIGAPPARFTPPGATPPHERANRHVRNTRLRQELGVELRYPTFEEGLAATFPGHSRESSTKVE